MADTSKNRLKESLEEAKRHRNAAKSQPTLSAGDAATEGATSQRSDTATPQATPVATPPAALVATHGAADLAASITASVPPPQRIQEATVRRAYTVLERQDDLLEELSRRGMGEDKGDVLRQIIDEWTAIRLGGKKNG